MRIFGKGFLAAISALIASGPVTGQVFLTNDNNNTIGEYTTSGATLNASLISGLNEPEGIAVSTTDIFVANYLSGTVSEYTTSGALVNASLITGLNGPYGVTLQGSDLFISNYGAGTIGEYSTYSMVINASLITGLRYPYRVAVFLDPICTLPAMARAVWVSTPYLAQL